MEMFCSLLNLLPKYYLSGFVFKSVISFTKGTACFVSSGKQLSETSEM